MADAKIQYGTQLLFADHGTDFGAAPATAANSIIIGTPTDVQIDLTSLSASGGARASDKTADLGVTRDHMYIVDACIEFATAPSDNGKIEFYWAGTPNATAASGNPAGLTGSDAAFTDTSGNLAQMQYIGSLSVRNNTINIGRVGSFMPKHRYGILVVVNVANQAFATTMDETHVAVTPLIASTL